MLISPPFLPPRGANESDEDFLARAMVGGVVDHGGFPVSHNMTWHGGIHLTAPVDANNARLPVRAIADGTVIYMRAPIAMPADPKAADAHDLGYNGWTDNGVVVIRHDTEIGANAQGQGTQVRYFSIYMHLSSILPAIKLNRAIYRKAEIGRAGMFEGEANTLHFEIVCDDANLEHLIGRRTGVVSSTQNGRVDAVFGEMYFRLPVGTDVYAARPAANVVTVGSPLVPVHTTTEETFIGLLYGRGNARVTTYRADGSEVGNALNDADADYTLYTDASAITTHYRNAHAAQVPVHSAVYELLRFGRVLGPDALTPADTPHWRQINYPGGSGWVNLNASGVFKLSDADAPHWRNWWLIDDDTNTDSRSDSEGLLDLILRGTAVMGAELTPTQQLDPTVTDSVKGARKNAAHLHVREDNVQARLTHAICKFPTEWEKATVTARWDWLTKESDPDNTAPLPRTILNKADFPDYKRYVEALAFWEDAGTGVDARHWHFHPREFIRHFRQCGWLSLDELTQLIPRTHGVGNQTGTILWNTGRARFQPYHVSLNKTFRKYNILSIERQTHFLAQTYIETALWATMREYGRANQQRRRDGTLYWPVATMQYYTAFYGKGIMQLTWAGNYESYGDYRSFQHVAANHTYGDRRITTTSLHYWQDPRNNARVVVDRPKQWHPRYDPEIIADDIYNACDSGAHYWVSKNIGRGDTNINRVCDRGIIPAAVGRASVLVNGGGFGYAERQQYAAYIERYRGDSIETTATGSIAAPTASGRGQITVSVHYTAQRP